MGNETTRTIKIYRVVLYIEKFHPEKDYIKGIVIRPDITIDEAEYIFDKILDNCKSIGYASDNPSKSDEYMGV